MNTMTRQDLLSVTEVAKNKIIERLVTKYDVQVACDNARDRILESVQSMHLENQAMIRQINAQTDQSWRKIAALEGQLTALRREIRELHRMLGKSLDYSASDSKVNSDQSSAFSTFPVK